MRRWAWRLWLVAWAPLGVVALHSGVAAAIGHRREYDPFLHFLGGAAGAHCLLRVLQLFRGGFGRLAQIDPRLLVLAVMVVVTGAWELAEFLSDRVLGTRVQLGPDDTAMDIVLGVAGAIVAIVWATFANWGGRSKADAGSGSDPHRAG